MSDKKILYPMALPPLQISPPVGKETPAPHTHPP